MSIAPHQIAPGAPGGPSRWTHSTKEGLGTAYHTSCTPWFTLSHGIVDEIYHPAELDPSQEEWMLGVAFGASAQSSATTLLQCLAEPFERHRDSYVRQWRRTEIRDAFDFSPQTG